MNQIENQREAYYRKAGVAPGLPTMKGSYADPEVTGKGYNILIDSLGDHSVPENWVQHPVVNTEAGSNPGAPLAWGSPENPDDAVAGYGYVPCDTSEVEETFYYHSDHLGSTSYITDQQANVTQYDAYLPYGELLVDEHSSSADLPYKFNGKELDEETGLYYYGARYMNPLTSMWYGVDPLAEKYPNVSAFVYCMGNPVKLVDLDGRRPKGKEAACLSAHSYGDKSDNILIGGWKVSKRDFGIRLHDKKTGLDSQIYERINPKTKKMEYAYVFAGTADMRDIKDDVYQALGVKSIQYTHAVLNSMKIAKILNKEGLELTFVGHSLGGGLATLASLVTNKSAIAFNPAALDKTTLARYGVSRKSQSNVTSYVLSTDPLNILQDANDDLPKTRGNRINLFANEDTNITNGHGMDSVLKVFGIKNPKSYNRK